MIINRLITDSLMLLPTEKMWQLYISTCMELMAEGSHGQAKTVIPVHVLFSYLQFSCLV